MGRSGKILLLAILLLPSLIQAKPPIYTTYLWHMQQPIYWPDRHPVEDRYQYAWDSILFKESGNLHPLNNLRDIFGKDDRVAVYQWRVNDALSTIGWHPDAGVQLSYSGSLIENINSLANAHQLGYHPGWNNSLIDARRKRTSAGYTRNDILMFTYHHALPGLIDPLVLQREIETYQAIYKDTWGSDLPLSKGFFPAEMAFSERIIPTLVKLGIDWSIVSNSHISRAVENFPLKLGTGGENTEPPNKADQINPPQNNWWRAQIDRGCSPTNTYPYAMRPHYAKYVDPESGKEYKMVVVPSEQAMSWRDGYQIYGTSDIDSIAKKSKSDQPMLFVFSHDGDNAFGGGYSYYMESVPSFVSAAANKGYHPSTIAQYLHDHPVAADDVVHVEDGAWVNADGDMGSPTFSNWNWPLMNQQGKVDIANGWAEDERNWAIYTAAVNRLKTAEEMMGTPPDPRKIIYPWEGANLLERAWHFFLGGMASGYMYYGKALDMEVKPTVASNEATVLADQIINQYGKDQDRTAPTIWLPQRYPYNPGDVNFGAIYKYKRYNAPTDFWIWTFIHDVSTVKEVVFAYRIDKDGKNPLSSNQNEVFAKGDEVGGWHYLPMKQRTFPKTNIFNDPEIDFSELPNYIADEYYIHVDKQELKSVLIDYYVKAVDIHGNVAKSPIAHMWIGSGENADSSSVSWSPKHPRHTDVITIKKIIKGKGPKKVMLHWGLNNWQAPEKPYWPQATVPFNAQAVQSPMTKTALNTYEIKIGPLPKSTSKIDFVFKVEATWDNHGPKLPNKN